MGPGRTLIQNPSVAKTYMAVPRSFFDTNILLYIYSDADPEKQKRARELYREQALSGAILVSTHSGGRGSRRGRHVVHGRSEQRPAIRAQSVPMNYLPITDITLPYRHKLPIFAADLEAKAKPLLRMDICTIV
jgi:hypothetical protein